jgi:hypothetical protein
VIVLRVLLVFQGGRHGPLCGLHGLQLQGEDFALGQLGQAGELPLCGALKRAQGAPGRRHGGFGQRHAGPGGELLDNLAHHAGHFHDVVNLPVVHGAGAVLQLLGGNDFQALGAGGGQQANHLASANVKGQRQTVSHGLEPP